MIGRREDRRAFMSGAKARARQNVKDARKAIRRDEDEIGIGSATDALFVRQKRFGERGGNWKRSAFDRFHVRTRIADRDRKLARGKIEFLTEPFHARGRDKAKKTIRIFGDPFFRIGIF